VFDSDGQPLHRRGVSLVEPGLSFVGLHFLHAMSSAMIHGVGRDAEYIAERIASASHVAASVRAELRDIELVPVPVRASR
jgi:putative flavoprotein involved in K+ transport